jgi:hypothetical protein
MATAACMSSAANASLADDTTAIVSDSFSISKTTSPKFFASIDYAVYAPGDYSGSLTFPADQYVYCYQLFNITTSTSDITSLIIDIAHNANVNTVIYDTASSSGAAGGINPVFYAFTENQVQFTYTSRNPVKANQHSSVLIFTSDFAPDPVLGTGTLGTTTAGYFSVSLPMPTPEPASVFLMSLAAPVLLRIRRRKN